MGVLTFIIVAVAIVASITAFSQVAKFEVRGVTIYTPEQITAASEIKPGSNLFLVNKFDVSAKILKKFPYIERLKIFRRLPDTFVFEVTERQPAAYFRAGELNWLVDKYGFLLESTTEEHAVPLIVGAEIISPAAGSRAALNESERFSALTELLDVMQKQCDAEKIGWINIGKLYELEFSYYGRFRVVLGSAEELPRKLRMLEASIVQLSDFECGTFYLNDIKAVRFVPDAGISLAPPE